MAFFEGKEMTGGYGGPDIITSCSLNVNRGEIVGNTPKLIPSDWKYQVNKIATMVPKDIMSPVAKFANLKIP